MRGRIAQTVVVWLASLAVAAVLSALPGMATLVVLVAYLATLVVAEWLSRRISRNEPRHERTDELAHDQADWRTFLPAIFGTSVALFLTELSILDPPAVFLPKLAVVTTVAFGAFLVTDEVFRRRGPHRA